MLLRRGVIREWDPSWGKPKVVSPLQVVPKKGNKYRLILDLSKLNPGGGGGCALMAGTLVLL